MKKKGRQWCFGFVIFVLLVCAEITNKFLDRFLMLKFAFAIWSQRFWWRLFSRRSPFWGLSDLVQMNDGGSKDGDLT